MDNMSIKKLEADLWETSEWPQKRKRKEKTEYERTG